MEKSLIVIPCRSIVDLTSGLIKYLWTGEKTFHIISGHHISFNPIQRGKLRSVCTRDNRNHPQ